MNTLSNELKAVIGRRLEQAPAEDILSIVIALCANESENGIAVPSEQQIAKRFEFADNDEQTVRDRHTGLIWTRDHVSSKWLNWKDAREACANCAFGGFDDWRLPTIRELLTLGDYERYNPAIDPIFTCESSWYWTSTPFASSPGVYAWVVSFDGGLAYWLGHDADGFVRAVRGLEIRSDQSVPEARLPT
jgi:hypothetical protein